MSGPKHLWSGDWEHESEEATTRRVREPQPQEPEPAPAEPPRPRARRTVRPGVVPVAIAVIVIAGAAFALSKVLGSSDSGRSAASLLSPQPPHLTGNTRPIMWLGMEIVTAPQGVPEVETVAPNSNGDAAGVEPGDTILLVNNHAVGSTGSISDAIKGLHKGDRITMVVNTGGTNLTLGATLAAPPSPYP